MFWRFFSFIFCQLAAAGLVYRLLQDDHAWRGALLGGFMGGLIWLVIDLYRAAQFKNWLKSDDAALDFPPNSWWGQQVVRLRRSLRSRERLAHDSEHRLQEFLAALQASPNGVVLLDSRGCIEWFNQTAANHFGLDEQRDLQQHFVFLVRDPGFSAYYANADEHGEVTLPGRDSTPARPVSLSVQLHSYGQSRRLLLSRDVTALQQADAMRRDFVANVTHEIRTPLTVLAGFVETLQTLELNEEERQRYLNLMAEQSIRMQTLVNDLLTLSRIEGMALPGFSEWVDLSVLQQQLGNEARALSATLGRTGEVVHQLVFSAAPELEIAGSAHELLSAMSNLVSNAIRYTPAGGDVRVAWQLLGQGRLEFSVRDTGPGIAPEHLPRLTERFYRVDRSRSRETGGTGLGLAIVKHVLQRHGAELRISSTLGQGSVFTMSFPANRLRPLPAGNDLNDLPFEDSIRATKAA